MDLIELKSNCSPSGKVCYALNDGTKDIKVSVVCANCCTAYYEDNVEVTDAARIAVLKSLVESADCTDIIDCGGTVPDSKVCYDGTELVSYVNKFATRFVRASEGATTAQYISRIELNYTPSDTFCSLLDFAPNAIKYWTGTAYVDPQVLQAELAARGILAFVQGCEPKIDRFAVTIESNQLVFRFWSTENDYTAQSFYFRVSFSPNANGSQYGTVLFGSTQETFSVPESVQISIKSLNGVFYYYENGVLVTDPTRIAQLQAVIGDLGPEDIVCCPDCTSDAQICLSINGSVYKVVTFAGGKTYYKDGVEQVLTADIEAAEAAVASASVDNVVDCVEVPVPDGQVCYSIPSAPITQTYAVAETMELVNGSAGLPAYMPSVRIRGAFSGATLDTVNFSPAIQIWNGTSRISVAALTTALNASTYLAQWKAIDPRIDRFEVVDTGSTVRVYLFDNQNTITSANRIGAHSWNYSTSSTGSPIGGTVNNGAYTNIASTYTPANVAYKAVTANNVTVYYKDGVLLTSALDIANAQSALATATTADIVDCTSTVTCQAFFDTATFTATAGQTSFTLGNTPSGDIQFARNGAVLADAAASVTGAVVTYVPAQNNNTALVAGDRIEISYVYNVCTGGAAPTTVDGSETKVVAGTGTTVTGIGTTGNPYVINAAGLNVLTTVQPTPTATGNTTNLNSTFTDANGAVWIVDQAGDAIRVNPVQTPLVLQAGTTFTTTSTAGAQTTRTNYATAVVNTFGTSWNPTTGVLTIPKTGYYLVEAEAEIVRPWLTNDFFNLWVVVNGAISTNYVGQEYAPVNGTYSIIAKVTRPMFLTAGQTIDVRIQSTGTSTATNRAWNNYLSVSEIKG